MKRSKNSTRKSLISRDTCFAVFSSMFFLSLQSKFDREKEGKKKNGREKHVYFEAKIESVAKIPQRYAIERNF